jgi:hypothetical protein
MQPVEKDRIGSLDFWRKIAKKSINCLPEEFPFGNSLDVANDSIDVK